MSRRVTNLIESILGSAAAAGTVADVAQATYAPATASGQAPAPEEEEPSALETAAAGVTEGAVAAGKESVKKRREQTKLKEGHEKMVREAIRAQKDAQAAKR